MIELSPVFLYTQVLLLTIYLFNGLNYGNIDGKIWIDNNLLGLV